MAEVNELVILCRAGLADPLKKIVGEHGAHVITVHDRDSLLNCVVESRVLIAFSTSVIVPADILNRLSRAFNFHPGPPAHPGRDPHYWANFGGTKEFGCTTHIMVKRVDAGPILATRLFDSSNINSPEKLRIKTEIVMFGLFEALLPRLLANSIAPIDQQWTGQKKSRADFLEAGHRFETYTRLDLPPLEPYDLGNAHQFGLHTVKSREAAISAFSQAAEQRHPQALVRIARYCLEEGDRLQALRWLLLAQDHANDAAGDFLSSLRATEAERAKVRDQLQRTEFVPHKSPPILRSIKYPLAKPYFSD